MAFVKDQKGGGFEKDFGEVVVGGAGELFEEAVADTEDAAAFDPGEDLG